MTLAVLKREYEERRQALVDQLQKNPKLDPATQHQIYGAIKEIENFLKTIDYQISLEQERNINVELSRDKPSPFVEQTQKAIYHVTHHTKKLFKEHIPGVAKKVAAIPKQYFDKKKEDLRLRREIEEEFRARKVQHTMQQEAQQENKEYITLEHPHQQLPVHVDTAEPMQDQTNTINIHEKRNEPIPPRSKTHPSKKAANNKGGQHKPHHKGKRFRR